MPDITGKAIDRYQILEQLGEGGMAIVYKAYDTRLENEVAVKIIRGNMFARKVLERVMKRFEREAHTTAMLTHPNIIGVIDYGEYEESPYMVMPYISGGTLKQRIKSGGSPWQDAVRMLIPIARALDFAHQKGVIHRDVKPSNILLTQAGEPMLSDFGVAKLFEMEETSELTGTGMGVGTPEYMAPEQTGRNVDHRADIYSLGIVLYEMLTGRRPYEADTPLDVLVKQVSEPLPKPSQFRKDIPAEVEKILLLALAKKPDDRYQSMGEMAQALQGVADSEMAIKNSRIIRKVIIGWAWVLGLVVLVGMGFIGSKAWQSDQQYKATATYQAYAWSITQARFNAATKAIATATAYANGVATEQAKGTATAHAQTTATAQANITGTAMAHFTATAQALARVIDPDTVSILTNLKAVDSIYSSVFSPDGRRVAYFSFEKSVTGEDKCILHLISMADGKQVRSLDMTRAVDGGLLRSWEDNKSICGEVAFSPNGNYMVTEVYNPYRHDFEANLWQAEDGKLLGSAKGQSTWRWGQVAISPNGEILASENNDGAVRLWSVSDGKLLHALKGHALDNITMTYSADGEMLATFGSGTLRLWKVDDGKLLYSLTPRDGSFYPYGAEVVPVFSPDGEIVTESSTDVYLWRVVDGKAQQKYVGESVAFSPNGKLIAIGNSSGYIDLWRISDGRLLNELAMDTGRINSLVFSPNGEVLASGAGNDLWLWQVADGRLLRKLDLGCSPDNSDYYSQFYNRSRSVFSNDGKNLTSLCEGVLTLWGFQ
jgi:serine/threonine protein kinase